METEFRNFCFSGNQERVQEILSQGYIDVNSQVVEQFISSIDQYH